MTNKTIQQLTARDDRSACAAAERIITESRACGKWYALFDEFAALLQHPKFLVRNRALHLLAANARWDQENRFEKILPDFLTHVTDEKPITARQCVKALAVVGESKPALIPAILDALRNADLTPYQESMRPLIEHDIRETTAKLTAVLQK